MNKAFFKRVAFFVAPVLAAGVESFCESLLTAANPFDKVMLLHALGAAVLVDLALIKVLAARVAVQVS